MLPVGYGAGRIVSGLGVARWMEGQFVESGSAGSAADGEVQRVKETRAVSLRKGPPSALPERVGGAQIRHQVARGKDIADISDAQRLAVRLEHLRSGLDAF
jgi:hypothetical protein